MRHLEEFMRILSRIEEEEIPLWFGLVQANIPTDEILNAITIVRMEEFSNEKIYIGSTVMDSCGDSSLQPISPETIRRQ